MTRSGRSFRAQLPVGEDVEEGLHVDSLGSSFLDPDAEGSVDVAAVLGIEEGCPVEVGGVVGFE
jgi:hypothetical protein